MNRFQICVTYSSNHRMAFKPGTIGREIRVSAKFYKELNEILRALAFMGSESRLFDYEFPKFNKDNNYVGRYSWVSPCKSCAIEIIDCCHSHYDGIGFSSKYSPTAKRFED